MIEALFASTRLHWTAIAFYTAYSSWIAPVFPKLGEKYAADAVEETGHLRLCLDRLRFFGEPAVFDGADPTVPIDGYAGFLADALALESNAAAVERANILTAREAGDELSAEVFEMLLEGSEASIQEIESIQQAIEEIGLANWLANQT